MDIHLKFDNLSTIPQDVQEYPFSTWESPHRPEYPWRCNIL